MILLPKSWLHSKLPWLDATEGLIEALSNTYNSSGAQTLHRDMHILGSLSFLLFNLLPCECVCAELQSFGGSPSRFSNPAQIQPPCQMDSCAELNLTLLGLEGSSRAFRERQQRSYCTEYSYLTTHAQADKSQDSARP